MQIAESLKLPDELERARLARELVIFAGAGVSMGPPANLPGFVDLARDVAEARIPWEERYRESLDRYLGQAQRVGVLVQERARERLLARGGAHTPLHEHLLGLFTTPGQVRLITTNFDPFFTDAGSVVFGSARIPTYVGPALPPGRDFRGLVYLHGALSQPQDGLVLTDGDFAAAYMAEGWAARFLVGVFAERTVLFAGYSLGDPVMQYLMRALRPTRRWYAFCHEDESDRWADHGVAPVSFRTATDGRRYGDLNDGLKRWAAYAQASPIAHDRDLRSLVAAGPPSIPQDADYVRARLGTDAGRATFWRAAKDASWLRWVAAEGLLDAFTDPGNDDPHLTGWASWSFEHFSGGDRPPLLDLLRRRPLTLHPWFAAQLGLHLWRMDSLPPRPVLRQFVALLMSQAAVSAPGVDQHAWLLKRLVDEGFPAEAFGLLSWLTRLRLGEIERLQIALEDAQESEPEETLPALSIRITMNGPADELADLLERHGGALAQLDAEELLRLGIQRIEEAYRLLALSEGADSGMDWPSYGRTSIAPSNQDSMPHAEDVLILLVREALDHFSALTPARLTAFAESYSRDRRGLLRRLALYSIAKHASISPDTVLDRAVDEGWPRDVWVRPELYLLLEAHFARATEGARERFIDALRSDAWWGAAIDEHQAHARFSLSQKLLRTAPDSTSTERFAGDLAAAHSDWREGDADGFLTRIEVGWGGDEPSPIEAEQMLAWSPAEAYSRLIAELTNLTGRTDSHSLLGAVQQAVRKRGGWGAALFTETLRSGSPSTALAKALSWGLRDSACSAEEQLSVLRSLIDGQWPEDIEHAAGMLLEKWAAATDGSTSTALLDAFDCAADILYEKSRGLTPAILDHGWYERSINHPAGHAAQVWWQVADSRDRQTGSFVLSVDEAEKHRWERVLDDPTAAGDFARPILGHLAERLSAGDFPWAERTLFPVFDPHVDAMKAAQLWDGRLTQRQWSRTMMTGIRQAFLNVLQQPTGLLPGRSRELGDLVALLVAGAPESGFTRASLNDFILHASPEARKSFAHNLPRHLERLSPDDRRLVWKDLLCPYWQDRRTNIPLALDTDEVREMISWIFALPEVEVEVLESLTATHSDRMQHADHFLWQWKEDSSWVREHPDTAVGLVRFLAERKSLEVWTADDAAGALEVALSAGAHRTAVQEAAEELVAVVSSTKALALAQRLRDG